MSVEGLGAAEFDEEVFIALAGGEEVPAARRERARAFAQRLVDSPAGWRVCLQRLRDMIGPLDHRGGIVAFWCLKVVHDTVAHRHGLLAPADRALLRSAVLGYLRDACSVFPQPESVRLRLAAILCSFVLQEFPHEWPSLFDDVTALLERGPQLVDVYLNTLLYFNQDITAMQGNDERESGRRLHAANVKDEVRARAAPKLAATLRSIVGTCAASHPRLAANALLVLAELVAWLDLALVVQPPFLSLVYNLMAGSAGGGGGGAGGAGAGAGGDGGSPSAARHAPTGAALRAAAMQCMTGVIRKNIFYPRKFALLMQTQLLPRLLSLQVNKDTPLPVLSALAKLVNQVGHELIEIVSCASGVASRGTMSAIALAANEPEFERHAGANGIGDGGGGGSSSSSGDSDGQGGGPDAAGGQAQLSQADAARIADAAAPMLDSTLNMAFSFLTHPDLDVSAQCHRFVEEYLQNLKRQTVGGAASALAAQGSPALRGRGTVPVSSGVGLLELTPQQTQYCTRLFALLIERMRFPPAYDFERLDEFEEAFNRARQDAERIFKNLAVLMYDGALHLTQQRLAKVLAALNAAPWAEVEVTLRALLLLREALRLRFDHEQMQEMLVHVFAAPITQLQHPQVLHAYYELALRFRGFFVKRPDSFVELVRALMDARGVRHPSGSLRSMCCDTLRQLLTDEVLRLHLRPHVARLVPLLLDIVQPVLGRAQNISLNDGQRRLVDFESARALCEALGQLTTPPVTKERELFAEVMGSFSRQLELGLEHRAAWMQGDPKLAGKRFSQVINALASLSKGVNPSHATHVRDVLERALRAVLAVVKLLPRHEWVRKTSLSFLQRMLECLRHELVPSIEEPLQVLLDTAQPDTLLPVLELFNRCVTELREAFLAPADALFPAVAGVTLRAVETLRAEIGYDPASRQAHATERDTLQGLLGFFSSLLRTVASGALASVLLSARGQTVLPGVLQFAARGGADTELPDREYDKIGRNSVITLRLVLQQLQAAPTPPPPAAAAFFAQDVTAMVFRALTQRRVDPEGNASDRQLIEELAQLQLAQAALGADYLRGLAGFLAQRLSVPRDAVERYIAVLGARDEAAVLSFLAFVATSAARARGS